MQYVSIPILPPQSGNNFLLETLIMDVGVHHTSKVLLLVKVPFNPNSIGVKYSVIVWEGEGGYLHNKPVLIILVKKKHF